MLEHSLGYWLVKLSGRLLELVWDLLLDRQLDQLLDMQSGPMILCINDKDEHQIIERARCGICLLVF